MLNKNFIVKNSLINVSILAMKKAFVTLFSIFNHILSGSGQKLHDKSCETAVVATFSFSL